METFKHVLMVGAYEKHSGKTTLSEKIVRKFANSGIYAIKITIHRTDDTSEKYSITEDKTVRAEKDTGRLKIAGAKKVFWVRCNLHSAKKAIMEAMELIPKNCPVLCESNMARKFFKPGLFIMVQKDNLGTIKETAIEVEKYADLITISSLKEGEVIYSPDVCQILKLEGIEWKLADQ
ncbi:MAG: hypothetical protein ACOX2F_02125 [bacterium]